MFFDTRPVFVDIKTSNENQNPHKAEWEMMSPDEQMSKIQNPGHVDESKWAEAKKISRESYGEERWPFVMYMYEKL
jgi:hypothetical protein